MKTRRARPVRPLLFNGEVLLRAELDERDEGSSNDVALTIFNDDGRHVVVIDPGEITRLRRWLQAVEACRDRRPKNG